MSFKKYFEFNKKERNGIFLLLFILLITIVYYNSMHLFVVKTKTDFLNFKDLMPKLESVEDHKVYDSLFFFNPNTLNDEGWVLLGFSSKQLSIFRNYQSRGVVF